MHSCHICGASVCWSWVISYVIIFSLPAFSHLQLLLFIFYFVSLQSLKNKSSLTISSSSFSEIFFLPYWFKSILVFIYLEIWTSALTSGNTRCNRFTYLYHLTCSNYQWSLNTNHSCAGSLILWTLISNSCWIWRQTSSWCFIEVFHHV